MTTTFNFKAKKNGQPLYKQLARYFRDEIQEDHLQGGDMLPSIRKLTKDLKVSRTTVEAAYEILIDQGYVQNLPSRGFRITLTKPAVPVEMPPLQEESFHRPSFNFANHYIDTTTFDTVLWRRAISRVLHSLIRSQLRRSPRGTSSPGSPCPLQLPIKGSCLPPGTDPCRRRSPIPSVHTHPSASCRGKTSQFRSSRLSPS